MNLQIKHPLLAAPASIGGLELKNKIIMAPMGSNFAGEDGHKPSNLNLIMKKGPREVLG